MTIILIISSVFKNQRILHNLVLCSHSLDSPMNAGTITWDKHLQTNDLSTVRDSYFPTRFYWSYKVSFGIPPKYASGRGWAITIRRVFIAYNDIYRTEVNFMLQLKVNNRQMNKQWMKFSNLCRYLDIDTTMAVILCENIMAGVDRCFDFLGHRQNA